MGQREVNRLIVAAIRHREATRSGRGRSWQPEFLAAVDDYVEHRNAIEAARDQFLTDHPGWEAIADAVAAMAVHGVTVPASQEAPEGPGVSLPTGNAGSGRVVDLRPVSGPVPSTPDPST